MEQALMFIGFVLASYSIIANDAIQTLGTFLASNSKRPWWVLWLYGGGILAATLMWGWYTSGGDPAYGRLDKIPMPDPFTWLYVVPPIVLIALTRWGAPVSTTFLVLTIFAPKNLTKMLTKSLMGYFVAFVAAIVLYAIIAKSVEKYFIETKKETPSSKWVALQWISTGFLWTTWLQQDLANIFVYLPREVAFSELAMALIIMLAILAYIFKTSGGAIQKIVTSKTNTTDIRAATIIDFMFAIILYIFKEWSKIPMSTTWVFLGLLAGRELVLTYLLNVKRKPKKAFRIVVKDGLKALAGLGVSVIIALVLPALIEGVAPDSALSSAADVQTEDAATP